MATVGTVIIDVKADTAKLVSGMDRAEKSVQKSVENIKRSLVTMAGAYLGFQGASKAYDMVMKSGFAYNMQLEESKAGLVALSVAVQQDTIPIMERYANANKEATNTLIELQKINASTPHTLDQTNQIYKAMYVSMKNAGASTSDLISLTKQISIAAGAGGIEFNSLLAGVDGLATGTVLANSDLGRFLSSLGLTNKALKDSDNVVKLLEDKLKSFKAPDTMQVALSNLQTQWDTLTGTITKTTFDKTKDDLLGIAEAIKEVNSAIGGTSSYQADVDFTMATLSRTIDMFNVLYEVAENTAQNTVSGIASLTYGTLAPITEILTDITRGLNSIGLSSDENLMNALKLQAATYGAAEKAQADIASNTKEISDALSQANVTIEERIALYHKEREAIKNKNNEEKDSASDVSSFKKGQWDKQLEDEQNFFNQSLNNKRDYYTKSNQQDLDFWNNYSKTREDKLKDFWYKYEANPVEKVIQQYKDLEVQYKKTFDGKIPQSFYDAQKKAIQDAKNGSKTLKADTSVFDGWTDTVTNTFVNGIQDALDNEFNFETLAKSLSSSIGNSVAQTSINNGITNLVAGQAIGSGNIYGAVAGIGLMASPIIASEISKYFSPITSFGKKTIDNSRIDNNIKELQNSYEPILKRLDSQINLLEEINRSGTASSIGLQKSLEDFSKNTQTMSSSILKLEYNKLHSEVGNDNNKRISLINEVEDFRKLINDTLQGGNGSGFYSSTNNIMTYSHGKRKGTDVYYTVNDKIFTDGMDGVLRLASALSNIEDLKTEHFNFADLLGGENGIASLTNSMQLAIKDFATDVSGTINELSSMSSEFADLYEKITNTNKYTDLKLKEAQKNVDNLIKDDSLENYLISQIENIDKLNSLFDKDAKDLLLSLDPKDLKYQYVIVNELQKASGTVFENGAADALNFLDSIKLVGEAMATSTSNIKSWQDSFKSQEQLATDMMSNFTYDAFEVTKKTFHSFGHTYSLYVPTMVRHTQELATSMSELDVIYQRMANDADGLTDSELEALNANKALLDAQQGYIDDLNTFADNLLSTTLSTDVNFAQSMALLNTSLAGFATSTDQSQSSSDIQTYANNAISYIGQNSSSLANEKYQTAVIANNIKDTVTLNDVGSFKTVEEKLDEMKVAIVAELSDIKYNTEKAYA